ncbi:Sor operon activator [Hartmannibacter diazotrophicus]|uniref:Sor operon activator n=1 Tax=Hartmannibacter diazotrophicus TaxID=1482074 RepID=A0A2C9D1V4_9HYPH|nr:sugar-binding domain-containing protein [Hartmannibacter diazotrophicus]SON54226.1 Sor operon activator [Hartmannibacter diazotrophicus]
MNTDRSDDGEAFLTEICWHYYVNEMTQAEIAAALGVTRLRVNQAIQQAKSRGMIKIQIESPFLPRVELQEELKAKYGLEDAIVSPANRESYDFHLPVGAALASYLTARIVSEGWKRMGVSWGVTLQSAISKIVRQSLPECEIISMIGGTSKGATFNSFGIASGFAERLGANYSLLAAPIFLSDQVDRDSFLSQEIFQEHFAKFNTLDVAILTASNVSSHSYLISTGLPQEVSKEDLSAAGAVGDVVGRFLDEKGNAVSTRLDDRTIGIDLNTLKSVPIRVLAAAGRHKVEIIDAAISGGIANRLITDDVTAELLLQKA